MIAAITQIQTYLQWSLCTAFRYNDFNVYYNTDILKAGIIRGFK